MKKNNSFYNMSSFAVKSQPDKSALFSKWIYVGLILLYRTDMAMAEENLTMTLAVASSVAVFMFAVLIGVIIVGITCNRWFDKYQSRLGRGKVPRIAGFWKKKKKTHHSLNSITSKAELNNYNSVIIPTSNTRNSHTDTWIKKWANDTRQYEEVSKEMQLGEEGFDEVPLTDVGALATDASRNTMQSEETGEMSIPSNTSTVIANHVSAVPQTEEEKEEEEEEEEEEENKQNPTSESLPANGDIDVVIL